MCGWQLCLVNMFSNSIYHFCAHYLVRYSIERLCNVDIPVSESHTPGLGCSPISSCGIAVQLYGSCSAAARHGWTPAALRSVCAFLPSFGSHFLEDLWFDRLGREAWSANKQTNQMWINGQVWIKPLTFFLRSPYQPLGGALRLVLKRQRSLWLCLYWSVSKVKERKGEGVAGSPSVRIFDGAKTASVCHTHFCEGNSDCPRA